MIEIDPKLNPKNWSKFKRLLVFVSLAAFSLYRLFRLDTIEVILTQQADYDNWKSHALFLFLLCYSIYFLLQDIMLLIFRKDAKSKRSN